MSDNSYPYEVMRVVFYIPYMRNKSMGLSRAISSAVRSVPRLKANASIYKSNHDSHLLLLDIDNGTGDSHEMVLDYMNKNLKLGFVGFMLNDEKMFNGYSKAKLVESTPWQVLDRHVNY